MSQARPFAGQFPGTPASDGAGVRLTRIIGSAAVDHVDPFLLFDEFRSDNPDDYLQGFPSHPHRGFETVTYMLHGRMRHKDSAGNEGLLTPGSVQWMTAGRGIIHSEMPEMEEGMMWGYQLWVNLPAKLKMIAPRYQDIPPNDIPEVIEPGRKVRVIAGNYAGQTGAAETHTPVVYLDVTLEANTNFETGLPADHDGFLHLIEGSITGPEDSTPAVAELRANPVLGKGDLVSVTSGNGGARFLLIAGQAIGEPISRHGPFVMNTREEIIQAGRDYQEGRLGRE